MTPREALLAVVDAPAASAGKAYNIADPDTLSDADVVDVIAGHLGADIEQVSMPAASGRPGFFWGVGRELFNDLPGKAPSARHQLLDTRRLRDDIGFVPSVDTRDALRRTVDWYVENRPEPGGEQERQLGDPFDYEAEDEFRAAVEASDARLADIPFAGNTYGHPYDHPAGSPA